MPFTAIDFNRETLRRSRERSARVVRRSRHKGGATKAAKATGLVATAALIAGAVGGAIYMRRRG